jgi:calmodulin
MIWEVDDDCDKRVNWHEFQAMFMRCRNDKTGAHCVTHARTRHIFHSCLYRAGYEPRRLYNVTEFLMNDKDGSGKVSVEEVMQILFLRYGRQLLDSVRRTTRVRLRV